MPFYFDKQEKELDVAAYEMHRTFPLSLAYCSVDSRKFLEVMRMNNLNPGPDAKKFLSILDRFNKVVRGVYRKLREFDEEVYPFGCGYISSAVCWFLNEKGFKSGVRMSLGGGHFYVILVLDGVNFILDYTADQFIPDTLRGKLSIVPVIIPEFLLTSLPDVLKNLYRSNEEGLEIPLKAFEGTPDIAAYREILYKMSVPDLEFRLFSDLEEEERRDVLALVRKSNMWPFENYANWGESGYPDAMVAYVFGAPQAVYSFIPEELHSYNSEKMAM